MNIQQEIFEAHISPTVRFTTDHGIVPSGWVSVVGNKLKHNDIRTKSYYKVDLKNGGSITSMDRAINAPLRCLAYDIESITDGGADRFPDARLGDPVIQIATVLSRYGIEGCEKTLFALDTCDAIPDVNVLCYETERELLMGFWEYFVNNDIDFLQSYNGDSFDTRYIIDRAEELKIKKFNFFGKERSFECGYSIGSFSSAQSGFRETISYQCPGVVMHDLLPVMRTDHNLRSYTLNAVSKEFLNNEKEDLDYKLLYPLQNGSSADRARIGSYCVHDTLLVKLLNDKLQKLTNLIEMSKTVGIPVMEVLSRGQSHKVSTKILSYTAPNGYLLPTFEKDKSTGYSIVPYYNHIKNNVVQKQAGGKAQYAGAFVLDPVVGFHRQATAVLDFSSLYPSVMQAFNMCPSTLIRSREEATKMGVQDTDIHESEAGYLFHQGQVGVLPQILTQVLAARKNAKRQMKNAQNDMERAVFDGKQLSLKIVANSVYASVVSSICFELFLHFLVVYDRASAARKSERFGVFQCPRQQQPMAERCC